MDRQTLRDWAHHFNDEGPDALKHYSGAGCPRLLTQEQMSELSAIVEIGPDPEVDGMVRWQCIDLKRVVEERFGLNFSERTLSDLLATLSISHIRGCLTSALNSPLKKASLTGFHATAKHIAAKAVSPSSETMRTI